MTKQLSYITLLFTLAFAIAPALTNPFSGFTVDQLPVPQIDPPIQPAGYAFAIWGLIYVWLIVSAAYGVWKRRDAEDWLWARVPLMISLAVGIPWLAIANASAIWATITILIMAAGAIVALIRSPTRDRWLFQSPTAIYAGWLTAASCVSIASTMAGYGLVADAFGWAFIGIALALIAALAVFLRRPQAPEYLFAVIWALTGIIVANGSAVILVSGFAAIGILVLLSVIFSQGRQFGDA
jgi:hypothetical protein